MDSKSVTSVQWNFLTLNPYPMRHVSPWGCPGTAHTSSGTFPYCPAYSIHNRRLPYSPEGLPYSPRAAIHPRGLPYSPLQCIQLQAEPASKGENQKISKWENTMNTVNIVNIMNTRVFMLWVWLKQHRLSFKVLPLEIGDRTISKSKHFWYCMI